jgi:hypothetical protein
MNKCCSVCTHPSRAEVDRGLLAGLRRRSLAEQYGVSKVALSRHLRHLQQEIALQEHQAQQARQRAALEQLELLSLRLDRLFHNATDYHSLHVALSCLRESIRLLSLQERLRLSLRPNP